MTLDDNILGKRMDCSVGKILPTKDINVLEI